MTKLTYHRHLVFVGLCWFALTCTFSAASSTLTLQESIQRVEQYTPILKSAQAELEQYQHLARQQARFANPAIALDAENIGGTDVYSGTDSAEYTVSIEQRFELGSKRSNRKKTAAIDIKEATLKLARTHELLVAETRRRFSEVILAQNLVALAEKRLQAAKQAENTVNSRQEAGAANALDFHRMEIAVSLEEIQYESALQALTSAKKRLAALWGVQNPDFEIADSNLEIPDALPSHEELLSNLHQSLSWQLNEIELERKQSLIDIEKSAAAPDLTLSAGRRWLNADDAEAWNVGFAIDLPLFDRNQDNIAAATAASRQSNYAVAAQRQQLEAEISRIYSNIQTAWLTAQKLSSQAVPKAMQTYKLVSEGYELGRYEILYLLEVQQTLFDIESSQLQAISDFFGSCNDLYEILAEQTPTELTF